MRVAEKRCSKRRRILRRSREYDSRQSSDRLVNIVHNGAGDAVLHNFGHRSAAEGENRRAAGHRLDHDEAERFWPIDREQQRAGFTEECALLALVDFADELNAFALINEGSDLLAEISLVDSIHFGGDLQLGAGCQRNRDRAIGPLLGRNPSKEREITASRIVDSPVQVHRQTMRDVGCEIGAWNRAALGVRDGYQRHLRKTQIKRE